MIVKKIKYLKNVLKRLPRKHKQDDFKLLHKTYHLK